MTGNLNREPDRFEKIAINVLTLIVCVFLLYVFIRVVLFVVNLWL